MKIENIINKYHYEGWIANFLPKIYKELINSLGAEYEPIIYEALLNTEIVVADNVYEALIERNMYEKDENSKITEKDYILSSGISLSQPDISFDGESYIIESIKRIVIIANANDEKIMCATLIHELGHLVKSYYNEYKIEGNILTITNGLIERIYKMEFLNGKVKTFLISEKGIGIEEGLNTGLEVEIARKILDPNWESQGYKLVTSITFSLLNNKILREMITSAQMKREKEKLITEFNNYFMEGSYEEFESILDKLCFLGLRQTAAIFDKDKLQETTAEINEVLKNEFSPLMSRMEAIRIAKRS